MKKVININFQGRVVMIEEDAYENLKSYIESLRRHFANEEGCDEIINDIENRISELFAETIKKGSPCVSEEDLDAIIHSIGKPEDFDGEEETKSTATSAQQQTAETAAQPQPQQKTFTGRKPFFRDENNKKIAGVCAGIANYFNIDPTIIRLVALLLLIWFGVGLIPYIILWIAMPSSATQTIGATQKRLYRDLSNKTIGGVCSGLANYFDTEIWIPKVIFLVGAFLSLPISMYAHWWHGLFFPGVNGFFITLYIVLWAVVPAAVTTSEKLAMKGESVDLNSIKNAVQEDLSGDKKKVDSAVVNKVYAAPQPAPTKRHSVLGDIIITLCKAFAYLIIGCILIVVVAVLFSIGVAGFAVYPLKNYLIGGVWQNTLVLISLLFLIWLPIVCIIIWLIRSITKRRSNATLRITFWCLWIVGLLSAIGLVYSTVNNNFKYDNHPVKETIAISQPKTDRLYVNYASINSKLQYNRFWFDDNRSLFDFRGRSWLSASDSIPIDNTNLQFAPSSNDSFFVSITKLSSGNSTANADLLAQKINYSSISQQDSSLNIPSYFFINPIDKFRNQFVVITVGVPVGKKIMVHNKNNEDFRRLRIGTFFIGTYNDDRNWDFDREYIMTKDGLKPAQIAADDLNNSDTSVQKIENKIQQLQEQKQRIKERREQQKEKSQQDNDNAISA